MSELTVQINELFELDGYYGQLLKSKHTRKAWPLLKKLMSPSNYRNRLEATIKLIESQSTES